MTTITNVGRWIQNQTSEFNIFEVELVYLENFDRRQAIKSTRLYIILLAFAITILTLYSALDSQNRTVIIQNPSQSDFEDLYDKYPNTLMCPCKEITVPYNSFISVTVNYHPVCSSIFLSEVWINALFNSNISYFYPLDFRSSATGQFQVLSSFCSFAKRFVSDAIDDFLFDTFLTPIVLSPHLLDAQSQTPSVYVRTSTSNAFRQLLQLIRSTTFSNQLQTSLQTSRALVLFIYNDIEIGMYTNLGVFSDINNTICSCGTQSSCSSSVCGFFDLFAYETLGDYTSSKSLMSNVTGFVVGCYAVESLLQSTLECFFNASCLSTILHFFPNMNITDIKPLDVNQTQYPLRTTIDTLVDNLFIEKWSTISSFTEYYNKCAPVSCRFTFMQRSNVLYVIIQLLGLYGGLVIVLRFCVPRGINWWYRPTNNQARNNPQFRFTQDLHATYRSILEQLTKLNLFDSNTARNNPDEFRTSIIATRVYIILTCIFIAILILYVSINVRSQTFNILSPSQNTFEDLYMKYSSTVKCPCKQIAVPFNTFVSLSPQYHSVCLSLFVSRAWLSSTSSMNWLDKVFIYEDFRAVGQTFFAVLQTLCSLADTVVVNAWYNFKQSSYITEQIMSEKEMIADIRRILNQFESNTLAEFKQGLALIRFHLINMYATASENVLLGTSDSLNSTKSFIDFYSQSRNWSACSCALNDQCSNQIGFYNYPKPLSPYPNSLKFHISGLFIGCFMIQSVLQSSLECFFNQTCLDAVQLEIRSNQSINIDILQVNTTRFSPQTLIEVLVDELMLEQWGDQIQYKQYYEQCAPEFCTYSISRHNHFSYILTLLIALFGGVSITMKVLVPFIVRWIRNRYRYNINSAARPTFTRRLRIVWDQFKIKIVQLNLFENELSWNDEQRRQKQILTTRIYVLLITIGVTILIIYTSLSTVTRYITIDYPSQSTFDQLRLNSRYLSTLACPCQKITIQYKSFITIVPHFHQLCSSDFIDENSGWIDLLYSYGIDDEHPYDDFRLFALPQFRTLSSLCVLVNKTLTDSLSLFESKILVSKQAQFRETVQSQAQSAVTQFHLSTARKFVCMLDFIRNLAQGNGIVSVIQSNWYFHSLNKIQESSLWVTARSYGEQNDCSCGINAMCTSPAMINGSSISGFRVGCYILDALLQSTLECLYNITCIDQLKSFYSIRNIVIRPLNQNLSLPNETVQTLVDRLLIDWWETNVSYEQYYAACSPLSCTYSIEERVSALYIVTIIIGLYGGLTVALKLVAPLLMKIGHYFIVHRQRRVEPVAVINPSNH